MLQVFNIPQAWQSATVALPHCQSVTQSHCHSVASAVVEWGCASVIEILWPLEDGRASYKMYMHPSVLNRKYRRERVQFTWTTSHVFWPLLLYIFKKTLRNGLISESPVRLRCWMWWCWRWWGGCPCSSITFSCIPKKIVLICYIIKKTGT